MQINYYTDSGHSIITLLLQWLPSYLGLPPKLLVLTCCEASKPRLTSNELGVKTHKIQSLLF